MVDNTIPMMAHNSNKATYTEQDEINDSTKIYVTYAIDYSETTPIPLTLTR